MATQQAGGSGEVTITINDDPDKALHGHTPVARCWDTLAANKIFIPSACGGKGTCGVCTVKVTRAVARCCRPRPGATSTRGEAREGVRLACQVKVKQDMKIELPGEVFDIVAGSAPCARTTTSPPSSRNSCSSFRRAKTVPFRAGGYIQIEAPPHVVDYKDIDVEEEYRADWDRFDLWRYVSQVEEPVTRAYSMASYPAEEGIIMLNVRIASPPPRMPDVPPGKMSSYIFNLKPGDKATISGPYGEFYAKDTKNEMCFWAAVPGWRRCARISSISSRRSVRPNERSPSGTVRGA